MTRPWPRQRFTRLLTFFAGPAVIRPKFLFPAFDDLDLDPGIGLEILGGCSDREPGEPCGDELYIVGVDHETGTIRIGTGVP